MIKSTKEISKGVSPSDANLEGKALNISGIITTKSKAIVAIAASRSGKTKYSVLPFLFSENESNKSKYASVAGIARK